MLLIRRAVVWAHCDLSVKVRIHNAARPGGERGSSSGGACGRGAGARDEQKVSGISGVWRVLQ